MSRVELFSILDSKSGFYGPLMSFKNQETAVRSFMEMIISGDQNSLLSLYPTDYILFSVGYFEQDTGFISAEKPYLVISGFDAMQRAVDQVNRRQRFQKALKTGELDPDDASNLALQAENAN